MHANQVTVQMCYSPINPAIDINMLEGRYVVKPELPFVPGNEGVGKIIAVGENVNTSLINKRVIFPFQGKSIGLGFGEKRFIYRLMIVLLFLTLLTINKPVCSP